MIQSVEIVVPLEELQLRYVTQEEVGSGPCAAERKLWRCDQQDVIIEAVLADLQAPFPGRAYNQRGVEIESSLSRCFLLSLHLSGRGLLSQGLLSRWLLRRSRHGECHHPEDQPSNQHLCPPWVAAESRGAGRSNNSNPAILRFRSHIL